jgi:zinc transport system permease protein
MTEFFRALANPDIPFLRYALIMGLMAGVSFGMIGSYVIARRISYIAGAIAHSVLGGIGIGLYMQRKAGIAWMSPMSGAVAAALISALIIGLVSMYARQREDTVIGAIWSIGMATGILFIAATPGYVDPMSYLFGNILLISRDDLISITLLDIAVIAIGLLFYHQFLAVCFDEEFAKLRGVPTGFFYLLLLCLTAITVVLLVRVVGIVMVIAMLTLPAGTAGLFSRHLWQMMIYASLLCMASTAAGLAASYSLNLPAGAVIVMIAGGVYLFTLAARRLSSELRSR